METIDEAVLLSLEAHFKQLELPKQIQLYPGSLVIEVPKFIQTQLSILRGGNNWAVRRPAYDRLVRLKAMLEGAE
jgi:hypothetical protein